jgi:hypothetical protein
MVARDMGVSLLLMLSVSSAYVTTSQQNNNVTRLARDVGKIVTLQGRFDGPGKLADYIVVDNVGVYLMGNSKPSARSVKYGTEVIVKGKLQHYVPPKADSPPTVDGQSVAIVGEHYFIESAELVGLPVRFSGGHEIGTNDYGRPITLMAAALRVKPEGFRKAFSGVTPAFGRGPTAAEARRNKEALMKVLQPLGVTNERMDEVANYYRFRPQNGELWPTKAAKAYAVVENGKIKNIVITDSGAGYCSPPKATVKGFEKVRLEPKLKFTTDLIKNGGVESIEVVNGKSTTKHL